MGYNLRDHEIMKVSECTELGIAPFSLLILSHTVCLGLTHSHSRLLTLFLYPFSRGTVS